MTYPECSRQLIYVDDDRCCLGGSTRRAGIGPLLFGLLDQLGSAALVGHVCRWPHTVQQREVECGRKPVLPKARYLTDNLSFLTSLA
jgi:hypothetical protein